jgi:hypothetical protein
MKACILILMACLQPTTSPYVDEVNRPIKALSAEQIDGYLRGWGMGLGKAAELNDYPGPLHVLNYHPADGTQETGPLALSKQQAARLRAIFLEMKERAAQLGKEIVDREAELDRAFAEGKIDDHTLKEMSLNIGKLQAELRYVHLRAHLLTREVLSAEQIRKYNELRGYRPQPQKDAR